jgi:hypothetical protein
MTKETEKEDINTIFNKYKGVWETSREQQMTMWQWYSSTGSLHDETGLNKISLRLTHFWSAIKFVETHLKSDTYCCRPVGAHAPSIQLCKALNLSSRIPCTEHGGFVHFHFAFVGCPVRLSVTKPFILTEVLRNFYYFHCNNLKIAYDCIFPILHNSPLGVFLSFGLLHRTQMRKVTVNFSLCLTD